MDSSSVFSLVGKYPNPSDPVKPGCGPGGLFWYMKRFAKSRSHAGGVFRGIGERPNKQKTPVPATAEIGRFFASERSLALLADSVKTLSLVNRWP